MWGHARATPAAPDYSAAPAPDVIPSRAVADRSSFVRDALLVADFDLRESLRTRRALVLVLLYLLIAGAASGSGSAWP